MSETPGSTEAGLGAGKGGARPGSGSILVIIIGVIAVIGLAGSGLLFMQLNSAKQKLAEAAVPEGLKDGAPAHDSDHGSDDSPEPSEAVYELGEFTANSADGKFVKMNLALVVKSFYPRDDWENYKIQLDKYEQQRQEYFEYQRGGSEAAGKDGHAGLPPSTYVAILLSGASPAHAAAPPKKEPEPPSMPAAPPARPLTRLESKVRENDARVRNIVITEINAHSAAELISTEGKADFKAKVMEALNSSFDRAYGEVVDIYFRDLVTT